MSIRAVWRTSWRFFWRSVKTGLLGFLIVVVPLFVLFDIAHNIAHHSLTVWLVGFYLTIFAFDVFMTFVPPALAFSTTRATKAISIGFGLLRRTWPADAWYVCVPPLAILIVGTDLARRHSGFVVTILVESFSWLLALLFKGAISAYYLRQLPASEPVADFGAAMMRARTTRCLRGHQVPDGARFCPTCGPSSKRSDRITQSGHRHVDERVVSLPQLEG